MTPLTRLSDRELTLNRASSAGLPAKPSWVNAERKSWRRIVMSRMVEELMKF
jgi:hypothetical protein